MIYLFSGTRKEHEKVSKSKTTTGSKQSKDDQKLSMTKDMLKIIRKAVKDLKDTKKAVYLNIINSFLKSGVEASDDVYELFKILDEKVTFSR